MDCDATAFLPDRGHQIDIVIDETLGLGWDTILDHHVVLLPRVLTCQHPLLHLIQLLGLTCRICRLFLVLSLLISLDLCCPDKLPLLKLWNHTI